MRGLRIALAAAIGGTLLVPAAPLADEPPAPPTAALEAPSTTVPAGKPIELDSSKSQPGSRAIVGHVWDLDGDGSFETDTGDKPTVETTPETAGPLTVQVRVVDDGGLNGDAKLDLTVTAPPDVTADEPAQQPGEYDAATSTPDNGAAGSPAEPNATEPPSDPPPAAEPTEPAAPAEPEATPPVAPLPPMSMSAAPVLLPPKALSAGETTPAVAKSA